MARSQVTAQVRTIARHEIELNISQVLAGTPVSNEDTVVLVLAMGDKRPKQVTLNYSEIAALIESAARGY
jgi:hypothetical protein